MKISEKMTVAELKTIAKKSGVIRYSKMKKSELIKAIKKAAKMVGRTAKKKIREVITEKPEVPPLPVFPEVSECVGKKFDSGPTERAVFFEEDTEELRDSYGVEKLKLLPRDSNYLFCFWEVSGERVSELLQKTGGGKTVLRVTSTSRRTPTEQNESYDEDVSISSKRHHLRVPESASSYFVELGVIGSDGRFHSLLRSNVAFASEDSPAPSAEKPLFVTIPFDLPLKELRSRGILSFSGYISPEGRFLTEEEYLELVRRQGTSFYTRKQ